MIKPVNENVLIKVLKEEQVGAVLMPDTHVKGEYGIGTVLAAEESCPVKVGDNVFFDKVLLTTVKIREEEYTFIKFSDILAYDRTAKA